MIKTSLFFQVIAGILLCLLLLIANRSFAHLTNRTGYKLYSPHLINSDSILVNEIFKKATELSETNQFDSAHIYFEKALSMYENSMNWKGVVNCYNGIGYNYRDKGIYSPALKNLNKALKIGKEKLGLKHQSVALSYYHIGKVYRRKSEFNSSIFYYNKALAIDTLALGPEHPHVAKIYQRIGMSYIGKFEYDKALSFFQKTYDIWYNEYGDNHKDIASICNAFGIVYRRKKDYELALKYAHKSLDIRLRVLKPGHRTIAFSYICIGNINADKGNYDLALENFEKALGIELRAYGEMHTYVASDYLRIGIMHMDKHNYDLALEYYQKALDIKLKIFDDSSVHVAKIYDRIGNAYRAKDNYNKSLEYFQKSLSIKLIVFGDLHPFVSDSYFLIGTNFTLSGNIKNGLYYLLKGLKVRKKVKGVTHFTSASFYYEIGNTLLLDKKYNLALENYTKSLNIYTAEFGPEHVYIANINRSKGNVFFEKRMYEKALNYYQKAINILVDNFNEKDINSNPSINNVFHKHELLFVLNDKASALEKKYEHANTLDDLKNAVSTFMICLNLIDKIKVGYTSVTTKMEFADDIHKTYLGAVRTVWKLYQITKEDSLLYKLFQVAEKSKAGLLRETISEMQAKEKACIPDSLLKLETKLKVDLAYLEAEIQKQKHNKKVFDTLLIKNFENKFFKKNRQYHVLIEKFEKEYPLYFNLKYNTVVANVQEIQHDLPDEKYLFLEYFLGEKNIYVFKISKYNIQINAVQKPSDLLQTTSDLQKSIGDFYFLEDSVVESYNLFTESAFNLHKLVFNNILSVNKNEVENIIIVPDGPLAYVPFEVLIEEKQKRILNVNQINYKSLPYLLKKYKINYSYSGTWLIKNKGETRNKPTNQCLAFAPIYYKGNSSIAMRGSLISLRGSSLNTLPGARQEVQSLSEFVKGEFRFGSEANEGIFKQEAAQFQILHLAMHGLPDVKYPSNSKLIFNTERDSLEDNALHVYELYNMKLNADLVVLSACETGYGQFQRGEGVMSMARAFMYAGCRSVVQTLWSTEDRSGAIMMTNFYKALSDGNDKSAALQKAKLKYIQSENQFKSHPFYWAGYTIYGDVKPIKLRSSDITYIWILMITIVLFGFLMFFWNIKREELQR